MKIDKAAYDAHDFSKQELTFHEIARVRFTGCDFRFTDFSEVGMIYGCVFDTCDFTSARLNGVTVKDCAFLSCKFRGASFFATVLEDCKMTGSDFTDAECGLAQIIGGDWSYTVLRKQSFQKQELCDIRFFGADLTGCRFNQCKLTKCDFTEAIVHDTSFYKSDLRGSSLESIDILEASFRQAKLDLNQCVLIAERVTEGRYVPDESPAK